MMAAGKPVNTLQIRHDEPFKTPFVPQDVAEQMRISGTRNAVQRVVGSHHGQRPLVNGGLERRQEILPQFTFSDE